MLMVYATTNKRCYWVLMLFAVLFTTNVNAQIPAGYYDAADGETGAALKSALNGIISGHTTYPYTSSSTDVWDILKEADEDPNNASNVLGIYSGFSMDAAAEYASGAGWSREHVWAKSRGDFGTSQGPGTDCHNIVVEDVSTNSARNNRNFDYGDSFYVDTSGNYTGTIESKTSSDWIWEPRDSKKGDVARIIFYMSTRYEGSGGEPDLELTETLLTNSDNSPVHAKLSVLLEWHLGDPVSSEEEARNEVVYGYQNNRNPFVDHPEYVCEIWTCPVITNNEPFFTSTAPTGVLVDASYSYSITTVDADGDGLTILATTKPSWLSFTDNSDGTATLSGTPTSSDIGDHSVVLDVDDGTANVEQTYTITVSSASSVASDLFVSEYIEGSSFNKGIEIANFTGASVDLSDYSLFKQTNGAGAWGSELALSGTLNNNEVYVVVHSSAGASMQAEADLSTSSNAMSFNGNDPMALFKSGTLIDVVGVFDDASNFAKDATLVRKSSVNAPNTTYTTSEWDTYSSDEFSYLGSHTFGSGNAPGFTSSAPTAVYVDGTYSYSITTNDAEGDAVTILATTKPSWLSFTDNGDGTATLGGVPSSADVGDNDVVLNASDGTDNTEQFFIVVVSEVSSSGGASDLFISEYIEGSSFNKGLEIANYTGAAVDLSDYSLFKQTNGAGAWGSELALSGTLSDNEVYVVVHSSADASMQAEADLSTSSNAMSFNGNDPVALFKSGALIDEVGTFNVTSNFAKDATLVRKSSVSSANTTYTTSEWDTYASNEFSYLGNHTFDLNFVYLEMLTPSTVSITTGDESSGFVVGQLIDNSGLSGTATPANYTTITSTENTADLWATTKPNGNDPAEYFDSGVADPVIEFTLSEMSIINSFIAWGFGASNSSGVAAGTLEFSTDGGTTYGTAYNFNIGTTALDPASGGFEMLGGLNVIANYVRLTITDNHKTLGSSDSGGDQVGFGEVKFIGETFDVTYNGSWTGGSGSSGAPDMSDVEKNLIVSSGSPTLTANASARRVAIQNGATLNLDPNVTMTSAEETIVNGAAALVLESNASGTANFIDNGFVYDYSGTATVEAYMDDLSLSSSSYHYISSPIDNHLKFTDMEDLYSYSEASLQWIHESTFTNFTNGNGYAIRYASTITKSYTGALNSGNISVAVTSTSNGGSEFEDKNLIGNPYPSSISADSLVSGNTGVLSTTLYLWNGFDYSLYNTALSTGTAGALGDIPDGNIAVGQAFFVTALTGGSVNFTNSIRGNDSDLFYKKERFPQLRLFVAGENGRSEFLLTEHKSSTFGKDKYDSEQLLGTGNLNISVWQGGVPYGIQSIPEMENSSFDLQLVSEYSQEVVFDLKELIGLEDFQVYLEDRENNTLTDISETAYSTYVSSGVDNSRFKLRIVKKTNAFHAYISNGQLVVLGLDEEVTGARLISIDGKTVAESNNMRFDNWSSLSRGVYLLEVVSTQQRHTQKIIK